MSDKCDQLPALNDAYKSLKNNKVRSMFFKLSLINKL